MAATFGGYTPSDLHSEYYIDDNGNLVPKPPREESKVRKALKYAGEVAEQIPAGLVETTGGALYATGDTLDRLGDRLTSTHSQGNINLPDREGGPSEWLRERGRDVYDYSKEFPDPGYDPVKILAREAVNTGLNYVPGGQVIGPLVSGMSTAGNNMMAQEEAGLAVDPKLAYLSGALSAGTAVGKTGKFRSSLDEAKHAKEVLEDSQSVSKTLFGPNANEIRKRAKEAGANASSEFKKDVKKKTAKVAAEGASKPARIVGGSVADNRQKAFFNDYEEEKKKARESLEEYLNDWNPA